MSQFMAFNFKELQGGLKDSDLQEIMTARREAHLFDVCKDVSEEILDMAERQHWLFNRKLIFPTPTGYLRLGYEAGIRDDNGTYAETARLTGMLWTRGYLYFFHDAPNSIFGLLPVKATIDYENVANDGNTQFIGSPEATAMCRLNLTSITNRYLPDELDRGFGQVIRDMMALALIAFDLFTEVRGTVQERESVPHAFASKHKPYFERTSLIKLHLRKCRIKYLREQAEPTGRKIGHHFPITHWCHYRITNPDCQHVWGPRYLEDDGKHEKCSVCGEWRTRRELPNGRGDKNIGMITTHHEVVR